MLAPPVAIDSPTGLVLLLCNSSCAIENGKVTLIDRISSGTQYIIEDNPQITLIRHLVVVTNYRSYT